MQVEHYHQYSICCLRIEYNLGIHDHIRVPGGEGGWRNMVIGNATPTLEYLWIWRIVFRFI